MRKPVNVNNNTLPMHSVGEHILPQMVENGVDRFVFDVSDIYQMEFHWRRDLFSAHFIREMYMHALFCFDSPLTSLITTVQQYARTIPNRGELTPEGNEAATDIWPRLVFQFYEKFKNYGLFEYVNGDSVMPLFAEHVSLDYIVLKLNNRPISQNLGRGYDI